MRKFIAGAAIIVVILVLWRLASPGSPPPAEESEDGLALAEESIVAASAIVLPARQAKLGFKLGGRVREVRVKAGDAVKAGGVLVALDDADLQQQVAVARAGLDLANATLAQLLAGSRTEEVAAAEAGYQGAVARYEQVLGPTAAADIQGAQANLAAARERLAQARAAAESELRVAESNLAAAQAHLDQLTAGPRAEDVRAAELQLDQAKNTLWATQIERDGIKGNGALPEYMGHAADAKVAAAETAVDAARTALAKLKAGAIAADLATARAAMDQAAAQLEIKRSTKDAGVLAAEAAVAGAEARLKQLQQGATAAERQQAASGVAAARAQLQLRQAGPSDTDLGVAEARVKQAEAALGAALVTAKEAALLAPFDGIVASVAVNEGQVLLPGEPAVMLGDLGSLRLETTDLRETAVARVRAGQPVTITLDAIPDRTLQGTVASIAPMASAATGGTNFTVKIELGERDPDLRWGMTANVEIATAPAAR